MILVVCPNLAVDVTLEVDRLVPGDVHRAASARRQAGGKGVNVARALRGLGEASRVIGFAAGPTGAAIERGLEAESIDHDLIPFEGDSRVCTILLDRDGGATVVNETGPRIGAEGAAELFRRFEAHLEGARAVALMGSLPPGLPTETYARMVSLSRERDRFCLVDTSGSALLAALSARPNLVKPNGSEAAALLGFAIETDGAKRRAAETLRDRGAGIAVVTFGANGVWVADGETLGRCAAETTDLRLGNPTGAGDSLAAGLLTGRLRGYSTEEMTRLGVAAATASLAEGYGRIRPRDIRLENVRFETVG